VRPSDLSTSHDLGRMTQKRARIAGRTTEKSYADRPLFDKLGIKPDSQVIIVGDFGSAFLNDLRQRAVKIFIRPKKNADLIFLAAEDKGDLSALPRLKSYLKVNGAIWTIYPKGIQRVRESDVREAAIASGLVDVKIVRFSETHTALKLVIPVAQR
jgi:hypothetical protein